MASGYPFRIFIFSSLVGASRASAPRVLSTGRRPATNRPKLPEHPVQIRFNLLQRRDVGRELVRSGGKAGEGAGVVELQVGRGLSKRG